jgi:hypothetical protein
MLLSMQHGRLRCRKERAQHFLQLSFSSVLVIFESPLCISTTHLLLHISYRFESTYSPAEFRVRNPVLQNTDKHQSRCRHSSASCSPHLPRRLQRPRKRRLDSTASSPALTSQLNISQTSTMICVVMASSSVPPTLSVLQPQRRP